MQISIFTYIAISLFALSNADTTNDNGFTVNNNAVRVPLTPVPKIDNITNVVDSANENTTSSSTTTTISTPTTTIKEPTTTNGTVITTATPTTTKPTQITSPPTNATTVIPTTTTTTTTKPTAQPETTSNIPLSTPATQKDRHFDGPSFIGGIVLAMGLMAIGFVSFKFYKARTERNYHTL